MMHAPMQQAPIRYKADPTKLDQRRLEHFTLLMKISDTWRQDARGVITTINGLLPLRALKTHRITLALTRNECLAIHEATTQGWMVQSGLLELQGSILRAIKLK